MRPLVGAFGDCCCSGGSVGWVGWLGGDGGGAFAAVVGALLLAAALLARPAALPAFELLGRLVPFAVLLVLVAPAPLTALVPIVPLAPLVPFVSLVPVVVLLVLLVVALFVVLLLLVFVLLLALLGPFVFCPGGRSGKMGSDDEIGDTLMIVLLAETR